MPPERLLRAWLLSASATESERGGKSGATGGTQLPPSPNWLVLSSGLARLQPDLGCRKRLSKRG